MSSLGMQSEFSSVIFILEKIRAVPHNYSYDSMAILPCQLRIYKIFKKFP